MSHGLTFSLRDERAASPVTPIADHRRVHQLVLMWLSYSALIHGFAGWHDVSNVADAINMSRVLVQMGEARDPAGLLDDADAAARDLIAGHQPGRPFRLASQHHAAIEAVLLDYEAAVAYLPARVMVRCVRRTEMAMRQALTNPGPNTVIADTD